MQQEGPDLLFIAPYLYVKASTGRGRGVFSGQDIPPMSVIETSSVLVLDQKARQLLDQTLLHDYIFEWGPQEDECCVAWGYVSLYNHSAEANCEYFMDYDANLITIKTVRAVRKGEELLINYNGDWNDSRPVWFDVK